MVALIGALTLACAVSPARPANSLSPQFGSYSAIGAGPIYGVAETRHGSVVFTRHGNWYMQKVLWVVAPRAHGAVTITLAGAARFATTSSLGDLLTVGRRLRIPAAKGWRSYASEVAIRVRGCEVASPAGFPRVTFRTA